MTLDELFLQELHRLDTAGLSKRQEKIITGFSGRFAIIKGRKYLVFNSNDYLGLRLHPRLIAADHLGSSKFGVGPGAVRFISGSLKVHRDLEKSLAQFHYREAAIIFSSAFAANFATIHALAKGSSKASLISSDILVISDELNHRSIIDGIRVANLAPEQRLVYRHLDVNHLDQLLSENVGKFSRCLIITDGVFSMLGEVAPLAEIRKVIAKHLTSYSQNISLYVDDCHGIGVLGSSGRGVEELSNTQADVLVGTLGKAFGSDGGYIVGSKSLISYLRESAAAYIYSNSITPGTASAAKASLSLVPKKLKKLQQNIKFFQQISNIKNNSTHAIQPLILGDPHKSLALRDHLFKNGFLVSSINYPIVPQGQDEIRLQLSAAHTVSDIKNLVDSINAFF